WVVAGCVLQVAEVAQGDRLVTLVPGLAVQGYRLGKAGGGSREVRGPIGQEAEFVQRDGLAGNVSRPGRRGQRGPLQGGALIPRGGAGEEVGQRGRRGAGVQRPPGGGGVVGGRLQVRPLGLQPGDRPVKGSQGWGPGGRLAGRRATGGGQLRDVPAGG